MRWNMSCDISEINAYRVWRQRSRLLRRVGLSLLLLPAVAISSVAQLAPKPGQGHQGAEEEIRELNAEEVQGFLGRDPKMESRVWSEDFVVTNPLNKFVSKKQVLGMMASGFLVITSYDRQIDYLRVYGDTAVVAGRETVLWGGRMPNAGKTEHLRFTGVWMKQGGSWREIARHANVVPPGD